MTQKRTKGKPVYWDEVKKPRTLSLTDTAWKLITRKALEIGNVSRSEVIERWAREKS
jgi:hypothetical protein